MCASHSDVTLRSWKEIADYLACSVSTAQRWEKREGLPVRRHVHEKLGSAYASASEIVRWKLKRTRRSSRSHRTAPTIGTSKVKPMLAVLPFRDQVACLIRNTSATGSRKN